ncbi:hypothetical protein GALL_168050 [mine drainage metagenome]|uniref:Glycosyl transferases group 1 n=1 Tax=mine drainage metagenome TaxID=410659 RepID=A0A1J5RZN0_9ZZZZ
MFDLFYKLPALKQQGVQIHLHCFNKGDDEQDELNKYCASVNYYERKKGIKGFSFSLPFIVSSRINERLFQNLLQDDHPILMEGIHCSYLLNDIRFNNRKKMVRLHNVEYLYYRQLFKSATSLLHKLYYWRESSLLKKYEKNIATKADSFLTVTPADAEVYRIELNCKTINFLPVFIPADWQLKYLTGKGNYCLYQGDLSIDTNEKAVIWLLEKVFKKIKLPLVIAGKNPSKKLKRMTREELYTCLVANPNEKEMQDMIAKAHIQILPSFTITGIKIKLLNALFNGRYVIANTATVEGSGLENLCSIADDADSFAEKITALFSESFCPEIIEQRKNVLEKMFCNETNAKAMMKFIWEE